MAGIDAFTKLLLHMNGANGSTTFVDSSSNNYAVTAVGNAQVDTSNSVFGGGSLTTTSNTDYLSIPTSADWNFGTGNFTIDFWVRTGDSTGDLAGVGYNCGFHIYMGSAVRGLTFEWPGGGVNASGTVLSNSVWNHVALVREGTGSNQFKMYVDGIQVFSGTCAYDFTGCTNDLHIAHDSDQNSAFTGNIDEFRISKGIARWTSNFTPPTSEYSLPSIIVPTNNYLKSAAVPINTTSTKLLDVPWEGSILISSLQLGNVDGTSDVSVNITLDKGDSGSSTLVSGLNVPAGKSVVIFSSSSGKMLLENNLISDVLSATASSANGVVALISYIERV